LTCSLEMVSIRRFKWANCPSTPETECLGGSWYLRDGSGRSTDRLGWESRDRDHLCLKGPCLVLVIERQLRWTNMWLCECRCSDQGGPKPTSKCCVTLSWMVMQGEHTGFILVQAKEGPTSSGEERFVFPCTEVLV
jgi:hypothetical protein